MSTFLLVYNTKDKFSIPSGDYLVGDILPNGEKVLVNSNISTYLHNNLLPDTTYYYRLWFRSDNSGLYSENYKSFNKTTDLQEEKNSKDDISEEELILKNKGKYKFKKNRKTLSKKTSKKNSQIEVSNKKTIKYSDKHDSIILKNKSFDIGVKTQIELFNISKEKQKKVLIESIMSTLFKSTPKDLIPVDPNQGGLPAIIDMFVDILMTAIETFAKQFFYLKGTIDKLAGMEIGELIGIYVPELANTITTLNKLLSDPSAWILQTLLPPLFEINIPIPEMVIDIGLFIPMLPFKLKIPKIDPYGYFSKDTPFNFNTDIKIPSDWYEIISGEIKKEKTIEKEIAKKEKEKKTKLLNEQILEFKQILNNVNKYTDKIKNQKRKIIILEKRKENCNECKSLCDEIKQEKLNLETYIGLEKKQENILLSSNKQEIINKQEELKKQKEIIKKNKAITTHEIKKISSILSYTKKIKDDKLDIKLIKIYDLGINIYDNSYLELLQKIGFDLSSDNYIKQLKDIGIFTKKYLTFLYDIGFNLNDPDYLKKMSIIKTYDSTILLLLFDLGFNLSDISIEKLKELKTMNFDINNKYILLKLKNIGYNFNNPNSNLRLKKLSKYIDINQIETQEIIERNININNPYYLEILKKSYSIGLRWGENYIETEKEILNDIDIPNNIETIKNIIYDNNVNMLKHYDDMINWYSCYGISLNFNDEITNINIDDFIQKLDLLLDFYKNKGWYKNGIRIDDEINTETYNNMVKGLKNSDGDELSTTKRINHTNNKISFSSLKGVYDNFSELSLNKNDLQFKEKFNSIFNNFKITLDSSVMLDTTKIILLTYTDFKHTDKNGHHPVKTINLSKNKANPELYTDDRYKVKISIKDVANKNYINQPTKTLAQFEVLQKLGFNFQYDNYDKFINKFTALKLNLKKTETKLIADSLISIGWHWSSDQDFKKLNKLIKNGLSFKIKKESSDVYVSQTYTKLEHLNMWGFNFNNKNHTKIIILMNQLNINLNNNDFDSIIENLIGFGITLKNKDWYSKLKTLIKLKFNFKKENWKEQLDNLQLLGINFTKQDWNKEYNNILYFNKLGINFMNKDINKKISILTNLGVDFSNNDWRDKINSLIELKLITVPEDVKNKKNNYYKKRKQQLNNINKKIEIYKKLNTSPTYIIDKEISDLEKKIKNNCEQTNLLNEKKLQRSNIEVLNINYSDEIKKLQFDKSNMQDNSFKINEKLIFGDEEKFKILDESGIDFFNKDYKNIINGLVKMGLSFELPIDLLKNKLKDLKDMIPINTAIEWAKGIIKIMKTIIMLPMQLLMGLIEKLLKMVNAVIGIPLNITKIPEWAKGIFKKFKGLIDMLMKLPTIEGLTDILFMNTEGLTLIDIVIPGFANFMSMLKDAISQSSSAIDSQMENIKTLKSKLKKVSEEINLNHNLLDIADGNKSGTYNIENRKATLLLKKSELGKINNTDELKNICDRLSLLENINTTNINKDDVNKSLKNAKNIKKETIKDIQKNNDKINELKNMLSIFDTSFCEWNNDVGEFINQTKILIKNMISENNPFDKLIEEIDKNIKKLKDALMKSINDLKLKNNLNKDLSFLQNQLDIVNEQICSNNSDELKKHKDDILNKLNKLNIPTPEINLDDLVKKLDDKLKMFDKQKNELKSKSKDFNDKIDEQLKSIDDIAKHLPVIIGIICVTPKGMINIIVEILNKVGHMDNLPDLWNFKTIYF